MRGLIKIITIFVQGKHEPTEECDSTIQSKSLEFIILTLLYFIKITIDLTCGLFKGAVHIHFLHLAWLM